VRGPWRWLVPALGALLAGVALWLILTDDGGDPPPDDATADTDPAASLDLEDSSQASVEELSGLDFPESASGFLSAQLDDGTQLDLTVTFPPGEEAAFLEASSLAAPVEGERVITHSSPLWDLDPPGTIRGVADDRAGVRRAVELVEEDGSVRVRAVITPVNR
jgi:hypothetical protein